MFLQRILVESVEHGGKIALTGVGKKGHNLFALVLGAFGYL